LQRNSDKNENRNFLAFWVKNRKNPNFIFVRFYLQKLRLDAAESESGVRFAIFCHAMLQQVVKLALAGIGLMRPECTTTPRAGIMA
jgi:hypothetical protein